MAHVQKNPLDGQGWLLLGESLLRQQQGKSAQLLMERALLLDPEAKWVDWMQEELGKVPSGDIHPDIQRLIRVSRPTIAAAIIVKNEERCIERCIRSLQEAVDEIVIVDSGSTDQTIQIIKKYPNIKLIESNWNDSFAELRNISLAHVTSDWILIIDADEWLHQGDGDALRLAAGLFHPLRPVTPMLHPSIINHINGTENVNFSVPRLFPNGRGIRFEGRIHEQISTEAEGIFTTNVFHKPVRIRIHHDGYDSQVKKSKAKLDRNIKLLKMMTDEDSSNPGWWYFRGRETMELGDIAQALYCFEQALRYGKQYARFGRIPEIQLLMGNIQLSQGRLDLAETHYLQALEPHADFPDAHFQLANLAMIRAQEQWKKAMHHVAHAAEGFHTYRGAVSADHEIHLWKADALKADLLVQNGHLSEAKKLLNQVRNRSPHMDRIQNKLSFILRQQMQLNQSTLTPSAKKGTTQ
ncbi:glycosyltransferase [Cohnella boryungensis]|uniref:Glycosyltransferase n=1 Tax=Cohnella boryungensis TaxID=768479 RepID=A0ABV8S5S7_9BACL